MGDLGQYFVVCQTISVLVYVLVMNLKIRQNLKINDPDMQDLKEVSEFRDPIDSDYISSLIPKFPRLRFLFSL